MKLILNIAVFAALLFIPATVSAQEKKKSIEEATFEVNGVCGMCKSRIETACEVKGVKRAEWDQGKHQLKVWYNPAHITLEEIHQKIAEAGHDTDKQSASDEAYGKIHKCCKYREMEKH